MMLLPYPQFCDYNNLKRIDATAEEHLHNLDLMVIALMEQRAEYLKEISERCPRCRGSGVAS